ncbi:MAG TPA: glycerol-3-phosphate responsive antiterminator [Candidatus Limnocylindrales bacterium]
MAGPSVKLPEFLARLAESPCCAAITSDAHLEAALASTVSTIFILRGDGLELRPVVRRIHAAGKFVAVHLDLIDGLRPDRTAIAWLARAGVDALISSHGQLMAAVRRENMVGIHRLLLTRRGLLDSGLSAVTRSGADIVEVLPGVILPDVRALLPRLAVPLLAGGFIRTEMEARAVLAAGAVGVTTSTESLWAARLV